MRRNQSGVGLALAVAGIVGGAWLFTRGKKRRSTGTGWAVTDDCSVARVTNYAAAQRDIAAYAESHGWAMAQSADEVADRILAYFEARFPQCGGAVLQVEHPELGLVSPQQWAEAMWEAMRRFVDLQQDAGAPILGSALTRFL